MASLNGGASGPIPIKLPEAHFSESLGQSASKVPQTRSLEKAKHGDERVADPEWCSLSMKAPASLVTEPRL